MDIMHINISPPPNYQSSYAHENDYVQIHNRYYRKLIF